MVRVIRDKILNHLVSRPLLPWLKLKNADTNSYLQGADDVPLVIVGNKSDLKPEHRQVTTDDGRQLAEELGCAFTEASAFLDFNVSKAFDLMIGEVEKSQNPSQPTGNNKCTLM